MLDANDLYSKPLGGGRDGFDLGDGTGPSTRLCHKFIKVNHLGWNRLVVESRPDSHSFTINGQPVCTATSSTYTVGEIGVAIQAPIFGQRTGTGHDLFVDSLQAQPLN